MRVGGVHEMEARASDEQHEGEVKVIERMADARGEEGRGTAKKDGAHGEAVTVKKDGARGEVVTVIARQVAGDGPHSPCPGGQDCGYACHDSPFRDPYHGTEALVVVASCPCVSSPHLSPFYACLLPYGAGGPAPFVRLPTSPFASASSRALPPFACPAPLALPSSVACSPLASPYRRPLLLCSQLEYQKPAPSC